MKNGTGTDKEIRKVDGTIFSLATKFLPNVMPAVSKIGGPLLTGALAGLGENLIDKIFGKRGEVITPPNKLTQMTPMLNLVTMKRKRDLNNAYQTGGNMYLRPTKRQMQHGGFWGALASIGIPLAIILLPKLFGKGLQVDKSRSRRSLPVYVPKKGSSLLNYDVSNRPNYGIPPIHELWENQVGFGFKKKNTIKKGKRINNFNAYHKVKHGTKSQS